jgi:hypothetical protein
LDVYFVVNIDSDPDPEDTPRDDDAVMEKYRIMKSIVDERVDGKGTICVQTSPMYRERFFEPHFLDFWRGWVQGGGDLTLHPEEDLYSTSETRLASGSYYSDTAHMEAVIRPKVELMNAEGLPFAAYKGGYQGLTTDIVRTLEAVGIPIDVTCAPGIDWPEKLAAWGDAPTSAYYMSRESRSEAAAPGASSPVLRFRSAGTARARTRPGVCSTSTISSTNFRATRLCAACGIASWSAPKAPENRRSSAFCATPTRCRPTSCAGNAAILSYMTRAGGTPVTATEAKDIYDRTAG